MFELPSNLFRWCLRNTVSGSDVFSYDICFPQYKANTDAGYLWESYDKRLFEISKEVRTGKMQRVLEVGCGFGHDLVWTATQGAIAVGIDVSSDFVEISKSTKMKVEHHLGRQLDITITRTNLLSMDDSEKFDLIYMKDVFHHLEPREKVVEKLLTLLAPEGKIIIVEPNALNPLIQWKMFRIRGFKTVIEKSDRLTGERYLFGNERLVTGREMCRLFQRFGLEGCVRHMRLLPTQLVGYKNLVRAARGLEKLSIEKMLPPACIHTIYM